MVKMMAPVKRETRVRASDCVVGGDCCCKMLLVAALTGMRRGDKIGGPPVTSIDDDTEWSTGTWPTQSRRGRAGRGYHAALV